MKYACDGKSVKAYFCQEVLKYSLVCHIYYRNETVRFLLTRMVYVIMYCHSCMCWSVKCQFCCQCLGVSGSEDLWQRYRTSVCNEGAEKGDSKSSL